MCFLAVRGCPAVVVPAAGVYVAAEVVAKLAPALGKSALGREAVHSLISFYRRLGIHLAASLMPRLFGRRRRFTRLVAWQM